MNGFHIQSMARDKRDVVFTAEVGDPIPGEDALDGDNDVVTVGAIVSGETPGSVLILR